MESESYITKNQIGLAGEFAVLSQLALRGYDANITLGNTKNVDILLSHPNTRKCINLRLKHISTIMHMSQKILE